MKVIALCLIALVAVNAVSLTKKYPFNYSKTRSIMNVMMEVENKLKNKSPLDAILQVLNDYRDAVNQEQVAHDEIHSVQEAECDAEDVFRSAQVQDATNTLRDSSAQLRACENQKIRAANDLEVNEAQTFSNQEHLTIVLSMRDAEQSLANRRAQEYADAIDVLDEAQDIVGSIYQGGADFVELSRVAKKMIQIAVTSGTHKLYAPVFASFAQLATREKQIDDSSLERVAQLIETLRNDVQEAYNAFAEEDAEAVSSFNDQKERLDSNLSRLEAQAARLEREVDELSQCIGTQAAIAQTAANKLQRNQQLWDQAQGLCHTFDNEYNYATQTRRHEIQLVAELEALVERRFAQVEDENAQRRVDMNEAANGF